MENALDRLVAISMHLHATTLSVVVNIYMRAACTAPIYPTQQQPTTLLGWAPVNKELAVLLLQL